MLRNKSRIPNFMSYLALNLVRGSLHKKCGHDVLSCTPQEAIKWIKTPSIFVIGAKDELVNVEEFQKMFKKCGAASKKIIIESEAGHPDSRAEETIEEAFKFLQKHSKIPQVKPKE